MEELRRFRVQREQPPPHRIPRLVLLAHRSFLDADSCAPRQFLCRVDKTKVLVRHHEANRAAAGAAPKALKNLPVRIHAERWRLLLVKWTKGPPHPAGAL